MAKDNRSIGKFNLDGIPPMRRGEAQIEVTFDIDANGILKVSAKEKKTGKEQSIRIEASTGLTDDEIKRMKNEAEANAESDKKAKEQVDKINEADSVIFQTEKQLEEYGDKIPADAKANIQAALGKLREAHQRQDVDAINRELAAVNAAWSAATQNMGADQGNTQNPNPNNNNNNSGKENTDDVTDVEFEEVDNK
jgi:molecular chaperone DnaK